MPESTASQPTEEANAASIGNLLPPIVFGTSALGNLYQAIDRDTKRSIVSEWFEHCEGIVAADSAGKYGAGLALECMADALRSLQVKPAQILISNKLGWRRVPLKTPEPTFEPGAWVGLEHDAVQDISYNGILRCWEQGCELMAPYRPQLVSVHDPDEYLAAASSKDDRKRRWDDILGAYQALSELRDRGEVLAIGVGSKDWQVSEALTRDFPLDWVMLATSLTVRNHPQPLLDFVETLRRQSISVINSAVFHAGFLTGGNHYDYRKVTGETAEDQELLEWRRQFQRHCEQFNVPPAEACVAFGMSPPGVVATALNSSQPNRIAQNVRLVSAQPPAEFWASMKHDGLINVSYPFV
ncbi:L-fuco-beta-pyranose dehydrogenase [Rhodopirellula islandica]|uniref:L-fuco-beta-pyranose dehydrogenase n=1 Tax=Rhodopirellula islandica TaxID=595434 RepID=A0A0J1BK75_RHOIS|nr:aldo/keto reductase [Rhodopirellula islandica]KLU06936.1 L-fuco-beta-pyranose dehydrogenase [Rhodopirellula islandica]